MFILKWLNTKNEVPKTVNAIKKENNKNPGIGSKLNVLKVNQEKPDINNQERDKSMGLLRNFKYY